MSDDTANPELERRIVRRIDGELNRFEEAALERDLLRDPDARRLMEQYAWADRQAADALTALLDQASDHRQDAVRPAASAGMHWRRGLAWAAAVAAAVVLAAVIWDRMTPSDRPEVVNPAQPQQELANPAPTPARIAAAPSAAPMAMAAQAPDDGGTVLPVGAALASAWDGLARTAAGARDGLGSVIWRIAEVRVPAKVAHAPSEAPPSVDAVEQVPANVFGPPRGQRVTQRRLIGIVDTTGSQLYLLEVDREQTAVEAELADL
ncbi:MAG: hypothetical protein ACE15C_17095 [Phycisphaerae bacterium]